MSLLLKSMVIPISSPRYSGWWVKKIVILKESHVIHYVKRKKIKTVHSVKEKTQSLPLSLILLLSMGGVKVLGLPFETLQKESRESTFNHFHRGRKLGFHSCNPSVQMLKKKQSDDNSEWPPCGHSSFSQSLSWSKEH